MLGTAKSNRRLALMLGLFPILAGCVRAGFDPWDDDSGGDGSAADDRGIETVDAVLPSGDWGGADAPRIDGAAPPGDSASPDVGVNRHALAFNGTNANVDLGAMLYSTPPNALTVEVWIKPATLPAAGDFAHLVYNGRHGQWTSTLGPSQLSAGPSIGSTWYRVFVDTTSIAP
jgi:hypothetical protein